MDSSAIHDLILVRSAEEADHKGVHLTWARREEATRGVRGELKADADAKNQNGPTLRQWQVLSTRAAILRSDAEAFVGPSLRLPNSPFKIGLVLCVFALVLGALSHQVGLSRSFNVLAGPFLAVFVWNGVVYFLLLYRLFRSSGSGRKDAPCASWLTAVLQRPRGEKATPARSSYLVSCSSWVRSWAIPMLSSSLHAGSAFFALGLLAAIYIRGINTAYYAGWESAWLGPDAIKSIVGMILGPASWISGISLPQTDAAWRELERIQGNPGIKAGMWIHLYAITMVGWVILPRLGLSAFTFLRGRRLRATPPTWRMDEPYLRRIFSSMRPGDALQIGVLPYDIKKPASIQQGSYRDAVERMIRETWGQGARSHWLEFMEYGSEDEGLDPVFTDSDCDGVIVLFDMRSTPEEEVHGCFLDAVIQRFRGSRSGILMVVEALGCDDQNQESSLALWKKLANSRTIQVLPFHSGSPHNAGTIPSTFIHHPN